VHEFPDDIAIKHPHAFSDEIYCISKHSASRIYFKVFMWANLDENNYRFFATRQYCDIGGP